MDELLNSNILADILAEELGRAMRARGIRYNECYPSGDEVHISFESLREAEELIRLGLPDTEPVPGSMYDRATSGCVSIAALAIRHVEAGVDDDEPMTDAEYEEVRAVMDAGWTWQIHPNVVGNTVGWHSAVDMSVEDAQAITVHLNRAGE